MGKNRLRDAAGCFVMAGLAGSSLINAMNANDSAAVALIGLIVLVFIAFGLIMAKQATSK